MDRKRKSALKDLKTFLNFLDDGDPQTRKTGRTGIKTISREKYPTCPAMQRKCPPKLVPLEFISRKKQFPLVPYREKGLEKCFQVHECSPSTTLCLKSAVREDIIPPANYRMCLNQSPPKRYPFTQKKSPRLFVIKAPDSLVNQQQQNAVPPPRCCQSKELRGGFMYRGCDCDKTNGLQDRCLRFCCLRNPKCKTRPAACYLSRFSGGRHLPDITTRLRDAPAAYGDFNEGDFDYEDQQVDLPVISEDFDYNDDYEVQYQPQKICCLPLSTDFHSSDPYSSRVDRRYPCCRRNPKVLNIPQVIFESPNDCCKFEPTKVCVVCPLNYLESPNDVCDEW